MALNIFRNLENLTPDCTDDEYDYVFRLWSLLIRLHLAADPNGKIEEQDLQNELSDYAQRFRKD